MNGKQITISASLLATLLLTGCVSSTRFDEEQSKQSEQMSALEKEISELNSELESQQQIDELNGVLDEAEQQAEQQEQQETISTYYVKAGDTFKEIADENQISLEELIRLNPQISNPDLLYVDQEITLQ